MSKEVSTRSLETLRNEIGQPGWLIVNRPAWQARQLCLMHDDNTCLLCGRETNQIHHINGNRKDNRVKNLMAICRKCHIEIHKRSSSN